MKKRTIQKILLGALMVSAAGAQASDTRTLRKTRCMEMTDGPNKESFTVMFESSRLLLNLAKADSKDFERIRIDLIEACQNQKPVDVSFNTVSQKITKFRLIGKKKKAAKKPKSP